MRRRLPARRTLPSRTVWTSRRSPISRTSIELPLNWNADVRDTTARPFTRESALISSSAMPSQKYSWSGSLVRLAKGSTAIAGHRVTGGVVSAMPVISARRSPSRSVTRW